MANDLALDGAIVDAGEVLHLGRLQEGLMRNVAKVIRHNPDVSFGGHPLIAIEAGQVYRSGIAAQGAFPAQVKVDIEVTQRQFAQGAVDWLAVTASRKVRFGQRAPMPAYFEYGQDVVGVVVRF